MQTAVSRETSLLHALSEPRYEVVPAASAWQEIAHLRRGSHVTITCSPKLGIDRTVQFAEQLSADGYLAIPHLAARQVRDEGHLTEIVDRLALAGVDDILALGGDNPVPSGPFDSTMRMLQAFADRARSFSEIGVTGYPEGHPIITESRLREALIEKVSYATYIVTQLCFSPERIRDWVRSIRLQGVDLPVYVGIPGRVSQKRLLMMATKVGVGESLRFLRRNPKNLMRMMFTSEYDPGDLVRGISPLLSSDLGVAGFHVYTFNAIEATERWRSETVDRLARASA